MARDGVYAKACEGKKGLKLLSSKDPRDKGGRYFTDINGEICVILAGFTLRNVSYRSRSKAHTIRKVESYEKHWLTHYTPRNKSDDPYQWHLLHKMTKRTFHRRIKLHPVRSSFEFRSYPPISRRPVTRKTSIQLSNYPRVLERQKYWNCNRIWYNQSICININKSCLAFQ